MTPLPRNAFGPNLATENADEVVRALGIKPGDRVLEVGGAANALPRANVVCDLTFGETSQRNGAPGVFRAGVAYVEAPAENLPFADGAFDFVWCTQVLEHVADPARAASELARVARRGFIEVPNRTSEMVNGNPSHRWVIDREGDTLVFHPRCFVEHPFDNVLYGALWRDPALRARIENPFRNVFNHQIVFDSAVAGAALRVRVAPVPPGQTPFNYDDPAQALRAHYSFARNCLLAGADVSYAWPDAHLAARLGGGLPEPRRLYAVYQARILQFADALATLAGLKDGPSLALARLIARLAAGEPTDVRGLPLPGPLPIGPDGRARDSANTALPAVPAVRLAIPALATAGLRDAVDSALTQDHPGVSVVVAVRAGDAAARAALAPFAGIARLEVIDVPAATSDTALINHAVTALPASVVGVVLPGDRLTVGHVDLLVAHLVSSGADAVYAGMLSLADGAAASVPLAPGNPVSAGFRLSAVLAHAAAFARAGSLEEALEPGAAVARWLQRLVATNRVEAVDAATVLTTLPRVTSATSVLDEARAALSLRPLDLYRELIGAHARAAALQARIDELEARPSAEKPA